MDTITQIILGAAVGEAVLGKKVGNKAQLWGAIGGTIPDLDVIPAAMMNPVAQLEFHRGFTHSALFAVLFAPILGYLIYRIYKRREASWKDWSWLAFWSVFTHPILDNFTSYGTAFLLPFSKVRIAWNTIFVIDPLYTIPLAVGILVALFLKRESRSRRWVNYTGIALSCAYLAFTVVNKQYVNTIFEKAYQTQGLKIERYITNPTPMNNLLWRFVGKSDVGFYEGYYSLLDNDKSIQFNYTAQNDSLIGIYRNHPQIAKLAWLTKGYYTFSRNDGDLYINDMRFGKIDAWRKNSSAYVFRFKLIPEKTHTLAGLHIERSRPDINLDKGLIFNFLQRIRGN